MLYIHEVGVLSDYHRQGIGLQMLTNIKMFCKELGICKMFLFTQKHNAVACALYKKADGQKINTLYDDDVTYFFNKF